MLFPPPKNRNVTGEYEFRKTFSRTFDVINLVEKATVTDDDEFVEGWKLRDRETQSSLSIKFVEFTERYSVPS